jgi:citrate lyase subunit beta/citryl-CoA lyase
MHSIAARARTLLFVPADRSDRMDKALASGAHMVIVDLEDAVGPHAKLAARAALMERWPLLDAASRARIAVRINAASTAWHDDDGNLVGALNRHGLGAVMLAKTESVAQLAGIAQRAGATPLLPLIESADGLTALELLARAPSVARLVFGHLDFQIDLGMQCGPDERELDGVHLKFVLASRRAGLPSPIAGVTVDLTDAAPLEVDTLRSRRFGFSGKLCIHPVQVGSVNALLGHSPEEVAWARRVLAAAQTHPADAFQFEGATVDAPCWRTRAAICSCPSERASDEDHDPDQAGGRRQRQSARQE